MYEYHYLNLREICQVLGFGRNRVLELCQKKPHGFPVIRNGNRYQADADLLIEWRDKLYLGAITLDDL